MSGEAKWYVVHTYSAYENTVKNTIEKTIVSRGLQDTIYEIEIPMETVTEYTDTGIKTYDRKLFPGYVLIKMVMSDEAWHIIKNVRGVTGFITSGSDRPVPLTEAELINLGLHKKEIVLDYKVGSTVKIVDGPFIGNEAKVLAIDIEEEEVELIRSAIEFNDQDAADIMTPRVDVTAIEDNATIEEAADLFRDTWFSRIPVYHEDLDHIVGILNEKDFYKMTHEGCSDITRIMKEPVFAPASLSIGNLLKQFRTSQTHMVILLDEFGGTEGIVTMEDVLEELVGEIYDEHDEVNEEVVEQEDGTLIIDGNMQLQELLDKLGAENVYDTDTVGGWAAEMLEKVPEVGNSFTLGKHLFTVTEMDGFRVIRMQVTEIPEEKPEAPEETEETGEGEKE